MSDYYQVLGVSSDATAEEIKKAYRKKARQLHPDYAGPESEEQFKEVSVAYQVLSDPQKRQAYDRGERPGQFSDFPGGSFGFADIFETMFSNMAGYSSGSASRTRPGRDLLHAVDVTLEDIVFGAEKEITYDTIVVCDVCEGTRSRPGTSPQTCDTCGGAGEVSRLQQSLFGAIKVRAACPDCDGTGEIVTDPCENCSGQGRVRARKTVSVKIPAGVSDGTRIPVPGQGEAGVDGGPAGNLYIEIHEKPDKLFTRDRFDLHTRITVPMTTAALGTLFSLETFDGAREVIIEPGTQPDSVITLKGLGIGRFGRPGRGDLKIHISVEVPSHLDDEQRSLLEQLAQLRQEERVTPESTSSSPFRKLKEKFGK